MQSSVQQAEFGEDRREKYKELFSFKSECSIFFLSQQKNRYFMNSNEVIGFFKATKRYLEKF